MTSKDPESTQKKANKSDAELQAYLNDLPPSKQNRLAQLATIVADTIRAERAKKAGKPPH